MTSLASPGQTVLSTTFYDDAFLYDPLRSGDDYSDWAQLLLGLIEKHTPGRGRLLDVGCGTGNSAVPFARLGFEVTACDISGAMLDIAIAKDTEKLVDYRHADMRDLPADLGQFSVINWMDDVANHLLTRGDLAAAMRSSAARLTPGGVLVFDVNATAAFRAIASQSHVMDRDDISFYVSPHDYFAPPYEIVTAKITGFVRHGELWRRYEHVITERYYSYSDIALALCEAGLKIVEAHSMHNDRLFTPPDEQIHGKVVYVASAA